MNDFNSVIIEVRDKIKDDRQYYEKNEEEVRSKLINPILHAIGWIIGDRKHVETNVKSELGKLDYLLWKRPKKVLIIEAKNLGTDISKKVHFRQILPYCSSENVRYCLMTNGLNWILFEPNKEKTNVSERILWRITIDTEDEKIISLFFQMISPSKIENIPKELERLKEAKRTKERIQRNEQRQSEKKWESLEKSWKNLLRNQGGIKDAIYPLFDNYLNKNKSKRDKFTQNEKTAFLLEKIRVNLLSESNGNVDKGITKRVRLVSDGPKKVMIKNSPSHTIEKNKQYEILTYSANWLIKMGKLKASNCPISVTGGEKYLVNTKPIHKDGSPFRGKKPLDNGLWIDTAFNLPTKIKYAKDLFEKRGVDSDTIRVE